jgi:hypothetical protein
LKKGLLFSKILRFPSGEPNSGIITYCLTLCLQFQYKKKQSVMFIHFCQFRQMGLLKRACVQSVIQNEVHNFVSGCFVRRKCVENAPHLFALQNFYTAASFKSKQSPRNRNANNFIYLQCSWLRRG